MNLNGLGGSNVTVFFKYERLPHICYHCGRFDHRERECQLRLDSSNLVRDASMKYGAWLRAPLGGGLKNVVSLNASVNKLPAVEKSEISPASEQDSPKKIYQNEAAVIEQSFMGVTGPISRDGGISNSKNSVTIEDSKLKKVEDAMPVMEESRDMRRLLRRLGIVVNIF
ncbi:unnamed protein product [Ilex paraguariensis]|uniref:CCHC-type domain-containing protein n=1 Tax=Ilex paraguariensis TaxID=185542 RepID=A0ABC8SEP9_9AQUA